MDVTQRRALEARLLEAQKLESIGRLAGGVAHDFNNMLTAILGNVDFAASASSIDEARPLLEEIRLTAERSAALTAQLLAFARRQLIEPKVFDYIDGDTTQFEKEPMEGLARDGQLMAYKHEGFWQCMDTLRDKKLLQDLWDAGDPPWKMWK